MRPKTTQDTRTLPIEEINRRREHAVRLRLAGVRLAEATALTGLSVPTIISAYKAFLSGGWSAVQTRARGRASGDGRLISATQEEVLFDLVADHHPDRVGLPHALWQIPAVAALIEQRFGIRLPPRTVTHYLQRWGLSAPKPHERIAAGPELLQRWGATVYPSLLARARREKGEVFWIDETRVRWDDAAQPRQMNLVRAATSRGKLLWLAYEGTLRAPVLIEFFKRLLQESGRKTFVILDGMHWQRAAAFSGWLGEHSDRLLAFHLPDPSAAPGSAAAFALERRPPPLPKAPKPSACAAAEAGTDIFSQQIKHLIADYRPASPKYSGKNRSGDVRSMTLTHLQRLEAESIHIMREVVAEAENPVMLYSIGKDSSVMLHLAMKAFYPAKPPFPLLHVDTTWKFREMIEFRDVMAKKLGLDLLVHVNPQGLEMGINPFTHGSAIHTDIMKTEGLKQALDRYGFDAAFGGARRDEEKSRAKERIFSFRSTQHRWDPKNQRPELWRLYNARKHKGESIRVFPISNWTELDIWQYIHLQNIPIVPLYYAKERPVVERDGSLIMVDDDRMPLREGEVPMMRKVRFRTLGCYPLTGAVESDADTLPAIIQEMLLTNTSERQGRVIDHDSAGSMEKKKQEGYF
jgi:sulfate adenylyltransferase subunit 2